MALFEAVLTHIFADCITECKIFLVRKVLRASTELDKEAAIVC